MKNIQELQLLYQKYLNDELAAIEIKQLLQALGDIPEDKLCAITGSGLSNIHVNVEKDQEESKRLQQVLNRIKRDHIQVKGTLSLRANWLFRISIAASIAVILSVGLYLYHKPAIPVTFTQIKPGGNKAILTLSNGTIIDLTDIQNGQITSEKGLTIQKTKNGQLRYNADASTDVVGYHTIATPKGGKYQVILADQTVVWLNAASSLKFPASFTGKERNVELVGEAYFEVAKDSLHPFIVAVAGQQVKVLGTHFNINAYTDEDVVNTTLLEGKVQISKGNSRKELLPGDQALTSFESNTISVSKSDDTESAIAWKNDVFYFDEASVAVIMRQISRWYDVEVMYKGAPPAGVFSGKISRNSSLPELIKRLSYAGLNCKVKNGRLIVEPNN
ncbi:FecR family protein [Pedobacter sp. ok626]|uniref:FecR family protein n=1 Tax=Pedobacter sp. ok626 TaxID=1761882 RepID=UPI000887C74C|nr:FecR family protein [Pedobacter sp. ok626]SDL66023.1 FecR family protein [Pedobacter sp. ok626]